MTSWTDPATLIQILTLGVMLFGGGGLFAYSNRKIKKWQKALEFAIWGADHCVYYRRKR